MQIPEMLYPFKQVLVCWGFFFSCSHLIQKARTLFEITFIDTYTNTYRASVTPVLLSVLVSC